MSNCKRRSDSKKASATELRIPMPANSQVTFVLADDLTGDWKGADESKAFFGLIPVIGGKEFLSNALLKGDLVSECQVKISDDEYIRWDIYDHVRSYAKEIMMKPGLTDLEFLKQILEECNKHEIITREYRCTAVKADGSATYPFKRVIFKFKDLEEAEAKEAKA